MGAWIEILFQGSGLEQQRVAPLVGAWIEMLEDYEKFAAEWSLPLWERGLKYPSKRDLDQVR